MIHGRVGFDAVLIGENEVLAVGDDRACYPGGAMPGSERAEMYFANNDSWHETGSLNKPRKSFATVGLDFGLAMLIGGVNADDVSFSSTKKFFPEGDRWGDGPLLGRARSDPRAVAMADGRTLVASQTDSQETSTTWTTEILDIDALDWKNATPTYDLTGDLVALPDGRVIHVMAPFESSNQITALDPRSMRWTDFPSPGFGSITSLVPLPSGDIVAFGWDESELGSFPSHRVMRYRASEARWVEAASIPTERTEAQITLTADGRLMVAGGYRPTGDLGGGEVLAVTEMYDPTADQWSRGPDLLEPRQGGIALLLGDGSVLILGGSASLNLNGDVPWCPSPLTSVERLYPSR